MRQDSEATHAGGIADGGVTGLSTSRSRYPSLVAATLAARATAGIARAQSSDAEALSRKTTDPTASRMAFNLITDPTGDYHGDSAGADDSWDLGFRPVILFRTFGASNIVRTTIPYTMHGCGGV